MSNALIKYCGVRSLEDLQIVSASRADFIGFIFAESKRKVYPLQVKQWLEKVDLKGKRLVAVFVNPTLSEVEEVLSNLAIDVIQFHGNELPELIEKTKVAFTGSIWKALHHHQETLQEIDYYKDFVDGFVIDSRIDGQWGGTGVSFDWSAVPHYINYTASIKKALLIAGGVNENNIEQLASINPPGIDISSGIEENDRKSKIKIRLLEERMFRNDKLS
ncbi:phosphoribosylanthranilate isomerase [Metabacillus malikii]|uniref:N-(5'-phosphoribosyl)anthranilate isomerase n=1 Tax=Metabacillus malikii TaxID=1504265 RepID=A0ABT9Z909_9BACI|nr:phosphoribosylanthranilate isomerase [Metabacillus malikii]MDQ0228758.1 phosphoribosylanthranilate isomerase [Metabacillus malikii]